MHGRQVRLILESPEQTPLIGIGVGEQAQRFVGVGGQNDGIKAMGVSVSGRHPGAPAFTADRHHAQSSPDAVGKRRNQPADVFAGTSGHRPPGMLRVQAEKSMVVEELDEGSRWKLQHPVWRRAPDGPAHRDEVMLQEIPSVAATGDIVSDRDGSPLRI